VCAAALLLFSLGGCAGYHIGPIQPYSLKAVHSISVPVFKSNTLIPRISVLVTNSVVKQFQQDGTYRMANSDRADAILTGTVERITRTPARSVRGNVLATSEFNLTVAIRYTLTDRATKAPLTSSIVYGNTTFFVGDDITTDERQAIPLAAEEAAVHLVSQLSEGW
jgi:hypothetical protein